MPDSASAALPGSRRCVLSMVLNPRMPTLEPRRDALASVSRRARIRHKGWRMGQDVNRGIPGPHSHRFPKPKDDPPGTPGWQQALRAWPRAAHDERHLWGDKTLTKTREEESGRVGSPGVQTYLCDTPDNVLGPEP